LKFDEMGIDVLLAGTQKAFAMRRAPHFCVLAAALAKSATMKDAVIFRLRGVPKERRAKHDASTPSIGHVYALSSKLDDYSPKALEARYARTRSSRKMTRDWAAKHGFNLFPRKVRIRDPHLHQQRCQAGGRTVDVAKLQKLVKDQGFLIDGGYGKLKAQPSAFPTWVTRPKPR